MFNKINIIHIVKDHLKTLKSFKTEKTSKGDLVLFFGLPIFISIFAVIVFKFSLDTNFANALITSLSVFSALLFNLLLLIYDILRKDGKNTEDSKMRRDYLKEIYANISYSILISIFTIILLLLLFTGIKIEWFIGLVNLLICLFLANFALTLLMVLKRVHGLLSEEMKEP